MKNPELPLFPLRTVLVPGGFLSLQIFEPRYLDLVRDCARDDTGFGVCLILEGEESGKPPQHAGIGTMARIRDFHTLPNGLLGIVAQGQKRFRTADTRVRGNGVLMAEVEWCFESPPRPVPETYHVLVEVLRRLLEKLGGQYSGWDKARLDDADWVSFRLTELLPLSDLEKQSLLGVEDAEVRLQRLLERLPDFQRSA